MMDCFFSLSPEQMTTLSFILAITIAENFDIDQQNVLGTFFITLGQIISMVSVQGNFLQSQKDNAQQIQNMREEMDLLKKQISILDGALKRKLSN
jgi:hypothetical protein